VSAVATSPAASDIRYWITLPTLVAQAAREGNEWRIHLRSDEKSGIFHPLQWQSYSTYGRSSIRDWWNFSVCQGVRMTPWYIQSHISGHWGHALQRRIICYAKVNSSISFPSLECVEFYVYSPIHPYDVVPFLALWPELNASGKRCAQSLLNSSCDLRNSLLRCSQHNI
jgi:hypothetical protein